MKKLVVFLVIVAGLAYGGATWYVHSKVSESMDRLTLLVSPYAKIQYDGIRSTLGGELTVENLTIDFNDYRDSLVVGRVGIDTKNFLALLKMNDFVNLKTDGIPDYIGFILEEVRIPSDADYIRSLTAMMEAETGIEIPEDRALHCAGQYGLTPELLQDLGFEEQVISMRMAMRRETPDMHVDMFVGIEDLWEADMTMVLAGAFLPSQMMSGSSRPKMRTMRLEYTDRSFNERVRKNCARHGLSEEEIFAAQLEVFKDTGRDMGIEFDDYVMEPFVEFLKGKDTLVVTAAPTEPVALSQIDLYKPSDVPALLKLEATAY